MDKSVTRVTVWQHSEEPPDAKTATLGTYLPIRTSDACQILIICSYSRKKRPILTSNQATEQTTTELPPKNVQ